MAKERKTNTIVSAIKGLTAALKLESIPNPTDEQKKQLHEAKVAAADVIENSNFMTIGEDADEAIEAQIQAEEAAEDEEAAKQAEEQLEAEQGDAEQDRIEEEIKELGELEEEN